MKGKFLSCLFFILATAGSAQKQEQQQSVSVETSLSNSQSLKDQKPPAYRSIITVSSFAPFRDQRLNVGYMHRLNSRWWLGTEIAYGQKGMTPYNLGFEGDYRIYEIKPEVYYSLDPKSRLKHFLSAELSYLNHSSKRTNAGYYDSNVQYYTYDSADFKRIRTGLSINYSILLHRESSWFGFMPKVGIGIAHRSVRYNHVEGKQPTFEGPDDLRFFPNFEREQSSMRLMVNVDMKFIFKF